jgi:hypothetical protein
VGKTTTAEILAGKASYGVHLESDWFFRSIRSGYVEPWKPESHEQNQVVMGSVAAAAAGYAAAGYFTVIEGIVIPGWFLEPLRHALHEAGCAAAYAVLREPLSVCLSRAQAREHQPFSDAKVIERLWQSFADLGDLERNAIDLGGSNPDAAAAAVEQLLTDGLLTI